MLKKILYRLLFSLIISLSFFNAYAQLQPIPDWAKDIGGTGESKLTGIAVDQSDNIYVAGNFQGQITIDHSGISTPISLSSNGSYDIFIAKYTHDGKLIWAKSIGGNGLDQINNLAVDDNGSVILGASFNSVVIDCDPGVGITNIGNSGSDDALIVKLDLNGNFLWARKVGSSNTDRGHVVTTDKLGNVIFVGSFSSAINLGSYTLNNNGLLDGFIVKYDNNGNILWAFGMGELGDDEIKSVKTNTNNEIVLMGYYYSSINLDPKGSGHLLTTPNATTYFVAKYTPDGLLTWANKIDGATPAQTPSSIAIGPTDDIFLTGVYSESINFNSPSNTITLNAVGIKNLFVVKYNNTGTSIWARNIQGNAIDPYSYYITTDIENNAYIGGFFDQNLIFSDGITNKTINYSGAGRNTFFGKYSGSGDFMWAFNFGSACFGNFGHKIAVDSKKNILLGGAFCSTVDFNPGFCALNLTAKHPTSDAYISKYNQINFTGDPHIVSFKLDEQYTPAVIDIVNKKITITVKKGTDVTKLKPTLFTDIGVLSPLSNVELDFTNPRIYTISSNCIDYQWIAEVLIGNGLDLCSNETTTISGLPHSNPNTTFQWEIKDGTNNWTNASGISNTVDYIFAKKTNNGNSNLVFDFRRKTSLNGTDIYDSETEITVHPSTINNIINTQQTKFCNGEANLVITGTVPVGAAAITPVFIWQQSINGTDWTDINNSNHKDLTPSIFTKTTFFRRITLTENCKSYSNEVKVEVFPLVTLAAAGTDQLLCNISTLELNANAAIGNEKGLWSVLSPTTYQPFTPLNINNPSATIDHIPENEEVILKWTIVQNDCLTESSDEIRLFNYSAPVFSMPTNFTINEGQTLAIPATLNAHPNVNYTYSWSPTQHVDDPTLLAPNVSPEETSIYHLTISYGNCVLEKEIKIIVNKAIKLDVCPNTPITLTGAVDNDALSIYQWQLLIAGTWTDLPNANKFDLEIITPENFSNQPSQVEYRRKVINSPYYDSRYLLTIATRTTNNLISTNETNFCTVSTDNLLIEGSTPTGAGNMPITFAWQQSGDGNTWINLSNTSKDLTITNLTRTTFFKRITYAGTCESSSNVLKIQINPAATIANAGENLSYCGATTVSLNANQVATNETGTWTVISPTNFQPFNEQSIHNPKAKIDLPLNEPVNLRWTIENHNCNITTSAEITLISYEDVNIKSLTTLYIDLGNKVNLGVTAKLSTKVSYTFNWAPSLGLERDDVLSPNAAPVNHTIYQLKISYGDHCFETTSVKVVVLKAIEIPNAFTPNGDGINDNWQIKNLSDYPGSKIFVYNRFGSTIYESNSYAIPWDGRYKNKILPVGTYYYVITLKNSRNSTYKGSVTILN